MVYGPGQRDGTKLVPYVIGSLLRGEGPRLSSGRREVDWVYVDDVVAAFVAAAEAEKAPGSTLDIGSGELVSIRSLVERIVRLVGGEVRPVFGALPDRPDERPRIADVAPSRETIGWEPSTPLELGLARTVEWFRARVGEARCDGADAATSPAAELVHHLQLDAVVQRHLGLPSEPATGTTGGPVRDLDIAGLRR